MKVRKLAIALALAGGLGSTGVSALGLGDIELQSYLNEPMDAEIQLRDTRGVQPGDVVVNLASEQAFRRVGLNRDFFLTNLQFAVTRASDGGLKVDVTSKVPVKEPYLNFLVEMTWPNGRLLREYAVLVDPPVFAVEEGNRAATTQAPATTTRNTPRTTTTAAPTSRPSAAPSRSTSSRSTSGYSGGEAYGPTRSSDTLWNIAEKVSPESGLSTQQVMMALQDLNPEAFINDNVNRLKRGQMLQVPTAEQARSRSRSQANADFSAQNRALRSGSSSSSTPSTASTAAGAARPSSAPEQSTDELRLVVPEETGGSRSTGSAGGDAQMAGGTDAGTEVIQEELAAAQRENSELNSRVDDLQEQLATLERLVALKDNQIATLQAQAIKNQQAAANGEAVEQPAESAAETPASGADSTSDSPFLDNASPQQTPQDTTEPAADAATDGQTTAPQPGEMAGDVTSGSEPDQQGAVPEAESAPVDGVTAGGDMATAQDGSEQTPPESATGEPTAQAPQQPAEPSTDIDMDEGDDGFDEMGLIQQILNNPLYQYLIGGGLIILMLALLLASRRKKEDEASSATASEVDEDEETDALHMPMGFNRHHEGADETGDPIEDAEVYIAYGRLDQAARTLENAIAREPEREDLRLKAMGVYAETSDNEAFDRHYNELKAFAAPVAMAAADELRAQLYGPETGSELDEMQSELRDIGSADDQSQDDDVFEDFDLDLEDAEPEKPVKPAESSPASFSTEDKEEKEDEDDFRGIDYVSTLEDAGTEDVPEPDTSDKAEAKSSDGMDFDWDLDAEDDEVKSGAEPAADAADDAPVDETAEQRDPLKLDEDYSDLSLEDAGVDNAEFGEAVPEDAALDGEGEHADVSNVDDALADLELDVSEDDLSFEEDNEELDDDKTSLLEAEPMIDEDELDLDLADDEDFEDDLDLSGELDEASEDEADDPDFSAYDEAVEEMPESEDELNPSVGGEAADLTGEPQAPDEAADVDLDDVLDEPKSEETSEAAQPAPAADQDDDEASSGLSEADLENDEDFDFLEGTDEAATKLDLARAYMEMGDSEGARDILEEVTLEGSDEQKAEAQEMLKKLD